MARFKTRLRVQDPTPPAETHKDGREIVWAEKVPPKLIHLMDKAYDKGILKQPELVDYKQIPKAYQTLSNARPKHAFTPLLPQIERMARNGMRWDDIARRLALHPNTLHQAAEDHEDVMLALIGGRARGIDEATEMLHRMGQAGEIAALTFRLKNENYAPPKAPTGPAVVVNLGDGSSPVTISDVEDLEERQRLLIEGHALESKILPDR